MSTNTTKLINPTDDQLSAAVAEHVMHSTIKPHKPTRAEIESGSYFSWEPNYATSADAVLPLLERYSVTVERVCFESWEVCIEDSESDDDGRDYTERGEAPTFPRAACIAILRANGIEVEQTAQPTRASS